MALTITVSTRMLPVVLQYILVNVAYILLKLPNCKFSLDHDLLATVRRSAVARLRLEQVELQVARWNSAKPLSAFRNTVKRCGDTSIRDPQDVPHPFVRARGMNSPDCRLRKQQATTGSGRLGEGQNIKTIEEEFSQPLSSTTGICFLPSTHLTRSDGLRANFHMNSFFVFS
jgi:hypothetical protein